MPRLTKIRIVGCKYDKFRKGHENSIFDLTRDGEPDHTLLTLKNQGGKGVLMQLISQIVLPETKWGKRNGNKITSMFYDQRNTLRNYTFHVMLEWKLDEIPEKWLITGICITSVKRNDSKDEEEEEKAGINYFLYTYEHDYSGPLYIENIPAYDRVKGEAVQYKEFEGFINDNSRDFIKFSQSSSKRWDSDYYSYLGSKGIYRSEWEILKEINRVEGGIGEYFSKAVDNKSIFDKLIIPAISQNMKNFVEEDSDSLRDMFKSHLSITKNLPKLLAREGDYKNLIYFIEPLIKDADTGIRRYEMLERCIEKGNDLYKAFQNKLDIINKDLEKWNIEEEKGNRENYELRFQRDNLEYAKLYKERLALESEMQELVSKDKSRSEELKTLLSEIKHYEINRLRRAKENIEKQKEDEVDKKKRLLDSIHLEDVKEEIKKVEEKIKEKWDTTEKKWIEISQKHFSYIKYLNREINRLEGEREKIKKLGKPIEINIDRFEKDKKKLEERKAELSQEYGMFKMSFPEQFLEELRDQNEEEKVKLDKEEEKLEKSNEKLNSLKIEKNRLEVEIKFLQGKIKKLEAEHKEIREKEELIRKRVVAMLNLEDIREIFREEWIKAKREELYELIEEKERSKTELKKELWENNMDKALNNRDYWIPNSDILLLKEEISSLGIKVQLGSQFIKNEKNQAKREAYLSSYPMLIYGLVIGSEREWDIIKNNTKEELLLHNPVPIFIRHNMSSSEETSFKVINNKGYRFILNEESFLSWKKEIENKDENIKNAIKILEDKLESIRALIGDIDILLNRESSRIIGDKIQDEKSILDEYQEKTNKFLRDIDKLTENIKLSKQEIQDLEKENEETETKLSILEQFVSYKRELEEEEKEIEAQKQRLEELNKEEAEINKSISGNKKYKEDEEINYTKWQLQIEQRMDKIKEVIPNAKLIIDKEATETIDAPSYSSEDKDIIKDLEYRNKLSMKLEEKNIEIKLIDKEIEILNEKIKEKENSLREIDVNWNEYEVINETIEAIAIKLEQLKETLRELKKDIKKIEKNILIIKTRLEGNKENIKNTIKNMKEKYPEKAVIPWEEENLDNKEYEIKRAMEENKKYLTNVKEIIDKVKYSKDEIKNITIEIKRFEELDPIKGKINDRIMEEIEENPQRELETWIKTYKDIKHKMKKDLDTANANIESFNRAVKTSIKDELLKNRILKEMEGLNINSYKSNFISFTSMKEHFNKEINKIDQDKSKAEEARNQWAKRAARHSIRMIESLKEMVSNVVYLNERGHAFPLVKLKGEELLPKEEEEVIITLKEYFVECIGKLIEEYQDIEEIEEKKLENLMNDRVIFSKALRGRYPKLMVYKMTEKNEFKYAKPREYHYDTWEAINKGEGIMTEGSGGQTLSISTFVIMMLMNYKKRYIGNKNPWTVLMVDNIVGKASGKHVLDPIFEIANKLNFQLLTFAAPEIIKAEISERFPVFWALKTADEKDEAPGVVTGRVVHGGRINKE